ncbi:putative membrane protein [Brucella rhizosphaerae]|uniref:Putative membrane protein n=1 Tax=Brucella rhizosphaerae TaxID=571254 RepID=A0A256FR74_9HYPH|nr:putative membrane protein [Brucella rhizosphaerae]
MALLPGLHMLLMCAATRGRWVLFIIVTVAGLLAGVFVALLAGLDVLFVAAALAMILCHCFFLPNFML